METYHKIQTLFKRDLDGSLTGKKGKMIKGVWTTPELEYLANNEWEFTEKVDGTNIRIGYDYDAGKRFKSIKFGGRTERAVLPVPLEAYLKDKFTEELMENVFSDVSAISLTLFGEGYGAGIQNGGNYRQDQSFVLFDVKIGDWWLKREDVEVIAVKLAIDSVPVIGYGNLYDAINLVSEGKVKNSDGASIMKSTWGDFEAEGIVARPRVAMFGRGGERIITKIKAVDFR